MLLYMIRLAIILPTTGPMSPVVSVREGSDKEASEAPQRSEAKDQSWDVGKGHLLCRKQEQAHHLLSGHSPGQWQDLYVH